MKNNVIQVDFKNERYEKLQKKRERLQEVLETTNLSPKSIEEIRDAIEKLKLGIDVPKLYITPFSK